MKSNRFATLAFEQLEDRINPGIIVPMGSLETTQRLYQAASGPGLANNGSYTFSRYDVEHENNDDTGFKENYWSSDVRFGATGYIDATLKSRSWTKASSRNPVFLRGSVEKADF